jgi:hypothetical protein
MLLARWLVLDGRLARLATALKPWPAFVGYPTNASVPWYVNNWLRAELSQRVPLGAGTAKKLKNLGSSAFWGAI